MGLISSKPYASHKGDPTVTDSVSSSDIIYTEKDDSVNSEAYYERFEIYQTMRLSYQTTAKKQFPQTHQVKSMIPSGFQGQAADVALLVNLGGVANGGPLVQIREIATGLSELCNKRYVDMHYIGPDLTAAQTLGRPLTSSISLNQKIEESGDDIQQQYLIASAVLSKFFHTQGNQGARNFLVITNGYTGFVPFGIKQAILENQPQFNYQLKCNLLVQDSALPDEDSPTNEVNEQGVPVSRFNHQAYASTKDVHISMITNNWLPVKVEDDAKRAPKDTTCFNTTFPFTEKTENWFRLLRQEKPMARKKFIAYLESNNQSLSLIDHLKIENARMVAMISSNGYFDITNVGKWMTKDQFNDVKEGVALLAKSLISISAENNYPLILLGSSGFVRTLRSIAESENLPITFGDDIKKSSESKIFGLTAFTSPAIPYKEYPLLRMAADFTVHRTSQANTHCEDILLGVPTVLLTMPHHGYMSVETMDKHFQGQQLLSNSSPQSLIQIINSTLNDPENVIEKQDQLYNSVKENEGSNFWSIVDHLMGSDTI